MGVDFPFNSAVDIIGAASNVKVGGNPAFTSEDFFQIFPQFQGPMNQVVLDHFIVMANAAVIKKRWHEDWTYGMCLFIAHFSTLYLRTLGSIPNPGAQAVIAAAQSRGLQTSKSVGDVSVSYDYSGVDFTGWPEYKTTEFGRQFAAKARLLAKGGMLVW